MKKKKILIITLTTLFLTIGGFALYMALNYLLHDDYKNWIEPPAVAQEGTEFTALSDSSKDITDMILAAENDQFKLYTNPTTSHVAIYDKESGMTAYSNPVDLEQDELATGSNRSELQSQLVIDYFDSNRNRVRVNNYDMSIASEQFTLEHIENGIRYTYVLADNTSETGIVPLTISEIELEERILSQLDESDARNIRVNYGPSDSEEGELVLLEGTIRSAIKLDRMNQLFEKAGFTQEDYDALLTEEGESERLSFTVALEYTLTDSGLKVDMPSELIEESEGSSIASIEVLKFFGAQGLDKEGFMLVPNGSGSLIYLNNGKKTDPYSQYVYDLDISSKGYVTTEEREIARLPIFGIKNETGGILAVIQSGDSLSQIKADVAQRLNSYNYVYPTIALRGTEQLSMFGTTGNAADLPVVERDRYDVTFSVEYTLLPGEDITYSDMATVYRNQLLKENRLVKQADMDNLPFYLDIVGGVQKQKEILGVPYTSMEIMTSFEEAQSIVHRLTEQDVTNIRLNYLGWFNGGYYHDAPQKIRDVRKLGGQRDMEALKETVEGTGGKLYGDVAFQQVSRTSKNYNLALESAKYYSGMAVVRGKVNPQTVRETASLGYDEAIYSIVSPKFLNRYVGKFADNVVDYPLSGVSLRDLGDVLSSDKKRTEVINRESSKQVVEQAFNQLSETEKSLMVTGGNAYSLPYAEDLISVPTKGADFHIVDTHIPFYQMVVHGSIPYTGEPINLSGEVDYTRTLLDLIETGSAPRYALSYAHSVEMKYTSLNHYYSTDHNTWVEQASEMYEAINEALKPVINSTMTAHEVLENGIRKITYDNGHVFYVNRSNEEVEVDGVSIQAMSFEHTEEGR